MEPAFLTRRLIEVREILGGCDLSVLLFRAPDLFLQSPDDWAFSKQRIVMNTTLLRDSLAGVPIERMVEEDPWFAVRLDVTESLKELRSLWGDNLSIGELQDSEPDKLLLALKALARVAPEKN